MLNFKFKNTKKRKSTAGSAEECTPQKLNNKKTPAFFYLNLP